jgi:hypothetical protein
VTARKYGVWIALLLTLAACYWVTMQENVQEDENSQNIEIVAESIKELHARKPIDIGLPEHINTEVFELRTVDLTPPQNLFSTLAVNNAEAEVLENQAPTATANPYTYAGKISENNIWTVFLTDGTNNFAVKVGDELQGGWRVTRIQTEALTFLYQPLKQEVRLETGDVL